MSRNATQHGPAGNFATSRRGGASEIASYIWKLHAEGKGRQAIATMAGVSMYDVALILAGQAPVRRPTPVLVAQAASDLPLVAQKGATGRAPFPFTLAHVSILEGCARREITHREACERIGCSSTALRNALNRMRG